MDFKGYWLTQNGSIVHIRTQNALGWIGVFFMGKDHTKYPIIYNEEGKTCEPDLGPEMDLMDKIRSPDDPKCPDWLKGEFRV